MLRIIRIASFMFFFMKQSFVLCSTGIYFGGISENSISMGTFLCGYTSITTSTTSGQPFQSQDCTVSIIQNALNYDISNGRTLQFMNNIGYWLKQKYELEQQYTTTNPTLSDNEVDAYISGQGFGSLFPMMLLITTNPIYEKLLGGQVAEQLVTIVAQLWCSTNDELLLWSQDTITVPLGTTFSVTLSSDIDTNVESSLSGLPQGAVIDPVQSYINQARSLLVGTVTSGTRGATYQNAKKAPRSIKLSVNS